MAPPLLGTMETALYASDLEAAEAFWSGVMGLAVIAREPGRHVFFRTAGAPHPQVVLIFDPSVTVNPPPPDARLPIPAHGTQGQGHVCLAVAPDALDAWRAHLEARHIAIEADFRWPGGARSIYFRDPAGNSIELAEPALWT